MSARDDSGTAAPEEVPLDLTRAIKRLQVPVTPANDDLDLSDSFALVFSRDSNTGKWAPRWLNQHGIQAKVLTESVDGLEKIREAGPDLLLIDANIIDSSGEALFQIALDAADLDIPVLVLCGNNSDVSASITANAYDVIRKPYEWELISRRASAAAKFLRLRRQHAGCGQSLEKALNVANVARERLRSRESFEPVTGLPNKKKFTDLVQRGMRAVDQDNSTLAVIVVGFNRFHLVIEAMGQDRADLVLDELSKILTNCLGEIGPPPTMTQRLRTAAVASIDHFRFAIMVTSSGRQEDLEHLQQVLQDRLAKPIQISGQTISLSACLGVAVYPQDADDVDSLMQRADNAMRDAQSRGGGIKYYCAATDAAAARKLKLEQMLHEAIDSQQLTLAYQPITEVAGLKVIAAEALLRWRQPDGSYISPTEFVPIAEECGLMIRIGEFVLEEACRQLKAWHGIGVRLPHMCVNLCKAQLMSGTLLPAVRRIIDDVGINPVALELELSERGILSGDSDVLEQLHELKSIGVRLSIDDFGTGDSSIAYLRELPVDVLKIDRSYIAGLTRNGRDAALVSAMIAIGQRLDLRVIAEGVETETQLATLRELECDAFQGFLVSEAVPGKSFTKLLKHPGTPE